MIEFEGLFFEEKEIAKIKHLEDKNSNFKKIKDVHLTFRFYPHAAELFDELLGKEFKVQVVGYGNDEYNSGLEIELPDNLIPYYINGNDKELYIPHITTSINPIGNMKNTRNLKFHKLPYGEKIELIGKFGYFKDKKIVFTGYQKTKKKLV